MFATSETQSPAKIVFRLWCAAAMLCGILFLVFGAYVYETSIRSGVFESVLTLSLATAWFIAFEALFVFVCRIGRDAAKIPSAKSIRRLIILTAWVFWLGASAFSSLLFNALSPGGEPPLFSIQRDLSDSISLFGCAIAAFFVCRSLYRWAKRRAPIPTEERAKLPDGIERDTLHSIAVLFVLFLSGSISRLLRDPAFPHYSFFKQYRLLNIAIGLAIALPTGFAIYRLLKRKLVSAPKESRAPEGLQFFAHDQVPFGKGNSDDDARASR